MIEKLNNLCEDLNDEEYAAMMDDIYADLYKAVSKVIFKYRKANIYRTDFQGIIEDVTDEPVNSTDQLKDFYDEDLFED